MAAIGGSSETQTVTQETVTRQARWLAYVTVGWMLLEAGIALWAAITAGSVALLGFGGDSVVEVVSGVAVLWRFSHTAGEIRERRAARLVGWSLVALAAFVAADSIMALAQRRTPGISEMGIAVTVASMAIMPVLARAKRRLAVRVGSQALAGDARQSDICAWLSAITLGGLALRAAAGWWWADPMAALVLVPVIVKEGIDVLRSKALDRCCAVAPE